jgi:DtxR family manganese transport transcriptional regulator
LSQDVKKIAAPPAVAEQAEGFRVTREARRNALTEDYVEMIAGLIASKGEARSVDLASRFGITQATVAKTILRLKREGFVEAERYGAIHLTRSGVELAAEARVRHQIVVEFLKRIGVAPDIAERDAEGIEHHVSAETLQAFARLSQ